MHIQFTKQPVADGISKSWDPFDLDLNPFVGLMAIIAVPTLALGLLSLLARASL